MTRRAFMGIRGGVGGLYVSQPGFDVTTAADAQLILNMSASVPQFIMRGTLNGAPIFIPISLPATPLVFFSNTSAKTFATGVPSFFRPWPAGIGSIPLNNLATVSPSGISFGGAASGAFYVVRQPAP